MKKIFISAAVVAASVFGVYTANQNNAMANLSDLQKENLEALADNDKKPVITVGTICVGSSGSCFLGFYPTTDFMFVKGQTIW